MRQRLTEVGVGPVEHPEIGKILDRDAEVGPGSIFPDLAQRTAVRSVDLDGIHKVHSLEPSRQDNEIILLFALALDLDALLRDPGNAAGLEIDVVAAQSGIVVVGDDDSLAARRVLGSQRIPQLGLVCQLLLQHPAAPVTDQLGKDRIVVEDCAVEGLAEVHLEGSFAPSERRKVGQQGPLKGRDGGVLTGDEPVRCALEDRQMRCLRGNFWDDLRGGCSW